MDYPTTPMEEAYGMYLLESVFQSPDINSIKVPGRYAVPFLSQSNLPRDLLRQIWSTVDPDSTGSLTSATQFYAILKLVALGQVGLLSSESNLQEALCNYAAPMPIFQGYNAPNESFLRNYYEHKTGKAFPVESAAAPSLGSIDDAFGGLLDITDAPLPSLPPATGSFDSATDSHGNATPAAGSLYDPENSVVTANPQERAVSELTMEPSMGGVIATTTSVAFEPAFVEPDLIGESSVPPSGDMLSSGSMNQPMEQGVSPAVNEVQPAFDVQQADDVNMAQSSFEAQNWMDTTAPSGSVGVQAGNWDALDALTPSANAPAPMLAVQQDESVEDDTFGDFEGISGDAVTAVEAHDGPANNIVDEDSTFGDFEGIEAAPMSAPHTLKNEMVNDGVSMYNQAQNAFDSFPSQTNGVVEQGTTFEAAGLSDGIQSGAFDSMAIEHSNIATDTPETDFMAFSEEKMTRESAPEAESLPASVPVMSEWGAFDALAAVEDAPLASLQDITRIASAEEEHDAQLNQEEPATETDGTDFGDFQEPATEQQVSEPLTTEALSIDQSPFGAFDTLAAVDDVPLPSLEDTVRTDSNSKESEVGRLGFDHQQVHDAIGEPPVKDDATSTNFQEPASAPQVSEPLTSDALSVDQSLFGAFDTLAAVDDVPLPSLEDIVRADSKESEDGVGFEHQQAHEAISEPAVKDQMTPSMTSPLADDTQQIFVNEAGANSYPPLASGDGDGVTDMSSTDSWGAFNVSTGNDPVIPQSSLGLVRDDTNEFGAMTTEDEEEEDADLFGDFADAPNERFETAGHPIQTESEERKTASTQRQFGSTAATMERLDSTYYSAQEPASEHSTGSDDFSGFVDAQSSEPVNAIRSPRKDDPFNTSLNNDNTTHAGARSLEVHDGGTVDFEAFGTANEKSVFDSPPENEVSDGLDGFAAFETAPQDQNDETAVQIEAVKSNEPALHGHSDNNSGDFMAFDSAPESESKRDGQRWDDQNESQLTLSPDNLLSAGKSSTPVVVAGQTDDNFAAFGEVSMANNPSQCDDPQSFDDFGDFASGFENSDSIPMKEPEQGSEEGFGNNLVTDKEAIVAKSAMLPPSIRRRIDGSAVDFAAIFDQNVGLDAQIDDVKRLRSARCLNLMTLLGGPHKDLASRLWRDGLQIIHGELAKGIDLTKKASCFSEADRATIADKVSEYVRGLGGFVLVGRCIAAVLAELLMLEVSATLTDDNLISLWNDVALAKQIADIELQWKRILEQSQDILPSSAQLSIDTVATIEELRRQSQLLTGSEPRCSFTLLPLTKAPVVASMASVVWEKREFFACSANFLANRCSFYNV